MSSKHRNGEVSDNTAPASSVGRWLGISATLPGVGAAILPAITCPACWPAYAGLLSSLGVSFIDYGPWILPITVAFLAIALASLAWEGYRRGNYGPLILGLVGSALLLVGKLFFTTDIIMYSGIALIISASIWNAWPRKTCSTN